MLQSADTADHRHPSPKFSTQSISGGLSHPPRYDDGVRARDPEEPMDSQLASDIVLGSILLIGGIGFVGVVLAFWSMGRAGYRKD